MSELAMSRISALLCQHLGLEVSSIGTSAVAAAVNDRRAACKQSLDAYAVHVEHDRTELAALVDTIIVPESWFFRDRVPFQHLAIQASKLVRKGKRVRILSAPCSTGEEPYSIAMSLVEAGVDASVVTIDAIDVSPPLLAAARAGIYRATSFRGVDERMRAAYFTPRDDDTWQLAEVIRAMVQFRAVNLLWPDALSGEAAYDFILCRNLLIYLTSEARTTVLDRFIRLLAEGGTMFVGHAEALEVIDKRFVTSGVPSAFAYMLRTDDAAAKTPLGARASTPRLPTPQTPPLGLPVAQTRRPTPPPMAKLEPEVPAQGRRLTPPPMAKLEPPLFAEQPRDLLAEASALANRGRLADAGSLVEQHLAKTGADAAGWALLGTIRQAGGDLAKAEDCFSRAVYCDPNLYTALIQLALLVEKRGDAKAATQLRARAERAKGRAAR